MATAKQKRKATSRTHPEAKFSQKKADSPSRTKKLQGRGLERAIEQFQGEADEKRADEQWKEIEPSIFGVQFKD